MKSCRALVLALCASIPTVLSADAIPVFSGEHENFTRLVLEIPQGIGWEINEAEGSSTISLSDFDDGFDLSKAFEIIPRTRLSALVSRKSELQLQLSCDCPIQAYLEQDRFLVVDIFDATELQSRVTTTALRKSLPNSEFGFGDLLWRQQQSTEVESKQRTNAESEKSVPNTVKRSVTSEIVTQTQERLMRAISEAASRGIVAIPPSTAVETKSETQLVENNEIYDASEKPEQSGQLLASNIRITSSRDVPHEVAEITDLTGAVCPDAQIVDVNSWGTDAAFGLQLAKSNATLFDELGRTNDQVVLDRVRLYIYFGFGAEAKSVMSLAPNIKTRHPELIDLAQILEYGKTNNPRFLHQFAACDSDLALWGMLSAQVLPEDQVIDSKAALRALERLPSHLQYALAEELAKRLMQKGKPEEAQVALRIVDRLKQVQTPAPRIIAAEIADSDKKDEQSRKILTDVISQDMAEAPEATISLIDRLVDQGLPVPADIALLAEAYALELRQDKNSEEMFRAFVLAAIHSEQFTKAYQEIHSAKANLNAELRKTLTSEYFKKASDSQDDALFLSTYFNEFLNDRSDVDALVAARFAKRLFELGFADEASRLTDEISDANDTTELRLLRAEAFKWRRDLPSVLAELDGLDTPAANMLRAEALEEIGNAVAAAQEFSSVANPERASSTVWLSPDWRQNMDPDDPIFGRIQQVTSEQTTMIAAGNNMLSESQQAIDASAMTRETITTLLNNLSLPN
ncbi:MAG: hypothetical protein AB8B47_06580 [Roseobacter sp.]